MVFISVVFLSSCVTLPEPHSDSDTLVLFPIESRMTGNWYISGSFKFLISNGIDNEVVDEIEFHLSGVNDMHYFQGLEPGLYYVSRVLYVSIAGNEQIIMISRVPFLVEEGCITSFGYLFTMSLDGGAQFDCDFENTFLSGAVNKVPQLRILRDLPPESWNQWDLGNIGIVIDEGNLLIYRTNEIFDSFRSSQFLQK